MTRTPEEVVGLALHDLHQSISHLEVMWINHPIEMKLEESWVRESLLALCTLHKKIKEWPPEGGRGKGHNMERVPPEKSENRQDEESVS